MSRYPRQVGGLVDQYENVDASDTYRIIEAEPQTYVLEICDGQDAMGELRWRTVALRDRLARLLLDAYGRERSIVLEQEVDDA